jgi:opacity protein-like surface antigen
MLQRATLALILLASASASSAAQERFPRLPPRATTWASATVGLYRVPNVLFDPASNSDWDFGSIVQFRGTLERDFRPGTALGVALTYARAPLTYDGPDCSFCDADVALWQALALFRIGGGNVGLHQIIEIGAGVTGFSNFQQRNGGRLAPASIIDPTVSIGYGLGYTLSANTQFMLVQEVGLMVHRRGNRPAGDESNLPSTYATRIGLRFGLGGWR